MDTRSRNAGALNGSKPNRRKTITAIAVTICLTGLLMRNDSVSAADQDNTRLQEILSSVAQAPLVDAPFIALKSSGLLAAPLESRGTLSFSANGPIEKHTTSPIDERITISSEAVRIERADTQAEELRFADNPELTAYAQALQTILGGEAAPLHEHFTVELEGDLKQWRLTLRPKSMRLQTAVSSLTVTGANGLITTIETVEASGDVDTLTVLLGERSTSHSAGSR